MITVLLVDDHALIRKALRNVLEAYNNITIVAEATDGKSAIKAVERLRPSVVVMDIQMPGVNGIEVTALISALYPAVHIVGFTMNAVEAKQHLMSLAGAHTLLAKELAGEQLYKAICAAAQALNGYERTSCDA